MLKRLSLLLLIGLFMVACKSKSPIITTKQEAIKKGNYRTEITKTTVDKKEKKKEKKEKKKELTKEKNLVKNNSSISGAALTIQNIVETALAFEGTRYKYGGTTSKGMDCSGLVYTSFLDNEITLPRSSYNMSKYGEKVSENDYQIGDLIFFTTSKSNKINHVGIITSVNDGEVLFIHSSTQQGVIISSLNESYYTKNFVQVNRVL
jgi:cell wall-associated NlpC family hydrolase